MLVLGPLIVFSAIGFLCWLFTLATFALPVFVGLTVGMWAFHTGAGALVAGGGTFGLGQVAMASLPWAWLRLMIILLFVAPACVAGYSAAHGIARIAMPSATWQMIFSVIGAIAVSVQAKGVRIVPEANRSTDNAPSGSWRSRLQSVVSLSSVLSSCIVWGEFILTSSKAAATEGTG